MLAVVAALLMLRGRRGGLGVEETDELALLSVEFFGSGNSNADDYQRITIIRVHSEYMYWDFESFRGQVA